ncbi:unnamed protein product [Xylocopa violacea]|uniref:Uncharacterized protein n=1 Tax=Xylocopa violacea TaxID=135666 RepID=A0ABP1NCR5_XYLVO
MKTKNRSLFSRMCKCYGKEQEPRARPESDLEEASREPGLEEPTRDPSSVFDERVSISTNFRFYQKCRFVKNVRFRSLTDLTSFIGGMEHGYVPGENLPVTVVVRRPCCKKHNDEEMCVPAVSKKAIK